MYKNILLPYDFSNSFDNVPEQLEKLVRNDPEHMITVFNVISEGEHADSVQYRRKHLDFIISERAERLEPFLTRLEELGLNYQVEFESGMIRQTILRKINNNNYDVVVMSNRRAKREIKHVLGQVTHKIAKRSNKPVMIVK